MKGFITNLLFAFCIFWLFGYSWMFSTGDYDWIVGEEGSDITSYCHLPLSDDGHREFYIFFLILFAAMVLIFRKKLNRWINLILAALFIYATYVFMLWQLLC